MAGHELFYVPYATLTDKQLPLLKVAALYFDRFWLLDPDGASWNTIGADDDVRDGLRLLGPSGIVDVIPPTDVLAKYERELSEAVRRDLVDPAFLELCESHARATGTTRWTLSLAKVPSDLQAEHRMQLLLGPEARRLAATAATAIEDAGSGGERALDAKEQANALADYAQQGKAYDERRAFGGGSEYRYSDMPLALGESLMMNHALFAGLLYAGATPVADDPFHSAALQRKLSRAAADPDVRDALADPARKRQARADVFAVTALTDEELRLPVLDPRVPLAAVLEFRRDHDDDLAQARDSLGRLARRIEGEPWSDAFADELEVRAIPELQEQLLAVQRARDSWLRSGRGRLALAGAGIAVGAGTVVLGLLAAPVTPIALTLAGLGLVSGAALPGSELLMDLREGRSAGKENGLHYLLTYQPS